MAGMRTFLYTIKRIFSCGSSKPTIQDSMKAPLLEICEDDTDILILSFENRCECEGCPGRIRHAIISFNGVDKMINMDYKKGITELIVKAEIAENPKKLCDWILKKARKHAYVQTASTLLINDEEMLRAPTKK